MGCDCRITVLGGTDELLGAGEQRVRELEASWTRFDSSSELSLFNSRPGIRQRVSPDLMHLLARGLAGYRMTKGLFNPFLGDDIVAAGYDRDFELLDRRELPLPAQSAILGSRVRPLRVGVPPLRIDRVRRSAQLEGDAVFDSGGIGKGLGADLVATGLTAQGAAGAMVSLGGDVRVTGSWPEQGWRIGIDRPEVDVGGGHVQIREGAVCTSGVLRRRWRTESGSVMHHLIDPATHQPVQGRDVAVATAIAPYGWRAEVLTKAALIGGSLTLSQLLRADGQAAVMLWDEQGRATTLP